MTNFKSTWPGFTGEVIEYIIWLQDTGLAQRVGCA